MEAACIFKGESLLSCIKITIARDHKMGDMNACVVIINDYKNNRTRLTIKQKHMQLLVAHWD